MCVKMKIEQSQKQKRMPIFFAENAKTGVGEVLTKNRLNLFTAIFLSGFRREPVFVLASKSKLSFRL